MLSLSEFFEECVMALVSDRRIDFSLDLRHSEEPRFLHSARMQRGDEVLRLAQDVLRQTQDHSKDGERPIRQAQGRPESLDFARDGERVERVEPQMECVEGRSRTKSQQAEILPLHFVQGQNDRKTLFHNRPVFSLTKEQKIFLHRNVGVTIERAVWAKQVHGVEVLEVSEEFLKQEKLWEADGLLTGDVGLPIVVRTADCLSVFIFDPQKKAIGLVHAGWRGSLEGILRLAIERMARKWDSHPQDFKIAFGPSIRACCYQVGEEFKEHFPREVQQKETGLYLDLISVNRHQLRQLGVKDNNIFDCGICTCCDENFFSYRREGEKAGRMISLMMLT